mmetsp:Transcript_37983/g.150964  ORF Transcript_37983/g.150964 Transcript_37983/m.150964 type:complete len:91 (-) Transcript_37983:357-629(-)
MGKSFADREEYIQRLRELINRPMLIEMTDGRVIQGLFHCIDHLHNIILSNAEERMMESSNQDETELLWMGLVIVPKEAIRRIRVRNEDYL